MPSEVVIRLAPMTPWIRAKTGVRALFARKQIVVLLIAGSFAPVLSLVTWAIGATPAWWIALALIPGVAVVLVLIALRALATGCALHPRARSRFGTTAFAKRRMA